MVGTVLDLDSLVGPQKNEKAVWITRKWVELEIYRNTWMVGVKELQNYLFARDTMTTTNKKLPWKNSTTVPKLTQIRDNLHANYMEAIFPNSDWLHWEGNDDDAESKAKSEAIEGYMTTKLRQDNAKTTISKLILDYIDYGNCFATSEWVDESVTDDKSGLVTRGYVGPRIVRISPNDILFNPTASTFEKSPKIIRTVKTLGELRKEANGLPPDSVQAKMLNKAIAESIFVRKQIRALSQGDTFKAEGYIMDGFSSILLYYQSDFVEILTFYGDLYDVNNDQLYENYRFTIMDRAYLIDERPNPDWTTHPGIFHAGWRQRPDNLYGMGPLDNLVGMQYRIDHLENLKADVFDMIAFPMPRVKGYVEDFDYGPGERVYIGEDGDVDFLHPPFEALQADSQIELLEKRMEELAGAPREAMGIRSPGEKTKFEVQKLDNAASRIFNAKAEHFQEVFLEKLLNYMLQQSRMNMSSTDVTRTLDSEVDAVVFSTITKDDLVADGILRPEGAQHFAEKANTLQNFIGIFNSPLGQDPAVTVHISGKKLAQVISKLADWDKFKLYNPNIRILEQEETKRLMNAAGEQTDVQGATPPGLSPGDPFSPGGPNG